MSEAAYRLLLRLYPRVFRERFEPEMLQHYRDCRGARATLHFWTGALRDVVGAVPAQWKRELLGERGAIDATLVTDALMITAVVIPLLLFWGWTGMTVALGLDASAQELVMWNPLGLTLVVMATLATAVLVGALSAVAASRTGRVDRLCTIPGDSATVGVRISP